MSVEQSQPDIFNDHDAALAAASKAGEFVDRDTRDLALLRFRLRQSWVYANNGGENPDMVLRIEPDEDGRLLAERKDSVGFIRELQTAGAPVENHLMPPAGIAVERAAGRTALYVATATEYLPGAYKPEADDYTSYGEALADLHAAGKLFVGRVPGFDPLRMVRETYDKLLELQSRDALPQVGHARFDDELMARLGALLADGEACTEKLAALNETKGYPPALLHTDVTPFNARKNREGRGVFIDLGHCVTGPWAYDFGRPLAWYRFGRTPQNVQTLRAGYAARAPWPVDPDMLELGARIAHVRYAPTLMTRVADMALCGLEPDEYLLTESIRRLNGEEDWRSEEAYIAAHTKRLQDSPLGGNQR